MSAETIIKNHCRNSWRVCCGFAFLLLALWSGPVYADCPLVGYPAKETGSVIHNADHNIMQVCRANGSWQALHTSSPPDCPTIGDTCGDGTIYAGLSPDGNIAMYAMPTDGPLGGQHIAPFGGYNWNDGSANWIDIPTLGNCDVSPWGTGTCNTGESNTTILAGLSGGSPAPYEAAQYCESLTSNGHSDWYLPARNELSLLYSLKEAGNGGFVNDNYLSSSESDNSNTWFQDFGHDFVGFQSYGLKNSNYRVRCVRR